MKPFVGKSLILPVWFAIHSDGTFTPHDTQREAFDAAVSRLIVSEATA